MSTKATIAHSMKPGADFHFYHEVFDDEAVYLELRGEGLEYEAGPDRVRVRIPIEVWEVIRERGAADLRFAGWTDEDIARHVEAEVDRRIAEYQALREDRQQKSWLLFGADRPREEQLAGRIDEVRELRDQQNARKDRIETLRAEQR
jgi:hypothetical protein